MLTKQEDIPATGHTMVTIPGKSPTCLEPGLTEGTYCSVCMTILTPQTELPAAGHTETVDPAKAATCTEAGLTQGSHCTVCGTVIIPQLTIPAIGGLLGDVNGDGRVTITDVELIYQYLTGQFPFEAGHKKAADVNRDGIVDVYDLQRLYEAVTGIDPLS